MVAGMCVAIVPRRTPAKTRAMAVAMHGDARRMKLRRMARSEVDRQGNIGPTACKEKEDKPYGTFTRL